MEPQDQGQNTPAEPQDQTPAQPEGVLTYTQEEFNRLMGQRARRASESALRDFVTQHGFEKPEELVQAATAYRESEEAAKSETDREREARLAAEQERDQYRSLADTRLVDSELRIALLNAGVPSDRVADAAALVGRDSIQVENGKVTGLEDAVKGTVESRPWLMAAEPTATQQQTFRAADTSQVPVNTGDPQAAMGSFLNQVLNGP